MINAKSKATCCSACIAIFIGVSAGLMFLAGGFAHNWATDKFDFIQKTDNAEGGYGFPAVCTNAATVQPVPPTVESTNQRANAVILAMMKDRFESASAYAFASGGVHTVSFIAICIKLAFFSKKTNKCADQAYTWIGIGMSLAATTLLTVSALMTAYPFLVYYDPSALLSDVEAACQTNFLASSKTQRSLLYIAFKHQQNARSFFCLAGSQLLLGILGVIGLRYGEALYERKAKEEAKAPWGPANSNGDNRFGQYTRLGQ